MKWLIIGAMEPYLKALRAHGETQLAVVEPDELRRLAVADQCDGRTVATVLEALEHGIPDVAVIGGPLDQRRAATQSCHEAGANIIAIQPVVTSTVDGLVAAPLRRHLGAATLRRIVAEGMLGDLTGVEWTTAGGLPVEEWDLLRWVLSATTQTAPLTIKRAMVNAGEFAFILRGTADTAIWEYEPQPLVWARLVEEEVAHWLAWLRGEMRQAVTMTEGYETLLTFYEAETQATWETVGDE